MAGIILKGWKVELKMGIVKLLLEIRGVLHVLQYYKLDPPEKWKFLHKQETIYTSILHLNQKNKFISSRLEQTVHESLSGDILFTQITGLLWLC